MLVAQAVPVRVRPSAPAFAKATAWQTNGDIMLQAYLPILIIIRLAILFGIVPLVGGALLRPKAEYKAKTDPYECGFTPIEDARLPFDVKFYLVAILFIIFDLETAFLFPWAVVMHHLGWYGITAMGIFVGLLIVGFIYEWKKGALEWE